MSFVVRYTKESVAVPQVEGWISEKVQVTSDEAYRDPTNLQSKLQKQAAFEAELQANRGRVSDVTREGEQLMAAGHFASMEIQAQLDALESLWRQLLDATQLRRDRLQDAYQVNTGLRWNDWTPKWGLKV